MVDKELDELNSFYHKCFEKVQEWGLDPYPIDFHIVPSHKVYEIAAYGIPGHFSHWSYGRDYWIQKTSYDYGISRIYELVINANPAQAFLLDTNSPIDNMFVIAHVVGHSDYFAQNAYFADTNRQIEYSAAATASRFRDYEIKYGRQVIEEFIDHVMTISHHIDTTPRVKRKDIEYEISYPDDKFLDLHPEERERIKALELQEKTIKEFMFPIEPDYDVLGFIGTHGRLKDWQQDIVMSMRDEMKYFLPLMQTKIMNEGWASIIHHKLMHELDPEVDPGGIDFADIHSSVLSPSFGRLNPYWLGFNIYKRIIERWDNPSKEDKEYLGLVGSEGWEKVLEVRAMERDETFLRNYLDEEVCETLDLFSYEFDGHTDWTITEKNWEKVRDNLVASKNGFGIPSIAVINADYNLAGHLYLAHKFDGRSLDKKWAANTLKSIRFLWGKPIYLETQDENGFMVQYICKEDVVKITYHDGRKEEL